MFSPAYLAISSESPRTAVRDIKKAILVLVFLVDAAHEGRCGRQNFVDEDKDGLFGCKLDALADDVAELADGQVGRHEIFLLVYGCDVGLLDLLTNDLPSVRHRVSREKWKQC